MRRTSSLKSFHPFIAVACLSVLGAWALNTSVTRSATQDERKLVERVHPGNPQVKITGLRTGRQLRKFNEAFEEGDGWLKRLSFQVENVSRKPIVYLQVNINFPETKATGHMMSYPVEFGQRPGSRLPPTNQPLLLAHGDKLEVELDGHYDRLARFMGTRRPAGQIRKAQIEIGFIIFGDKTAWAAGDFLRQDPDNPDYYRNVGPNPPH